jgi:hypothetical protein
MDFDIPNRMKNPPVQTTLPGLPDYRGPVIVEAQKLSQTITEAASAGFDAIRMECLKHNTGYKITFQRSPQNNDQTNSATL